MPDVSLQFGGDLAVSSTGDIAVAAGAALVQQRVLLRLMTNPGDYLWQLSYGAGLGQFVGQPGAAAAIAGIALAQMRNESAVATAPAPTATASAGPDGTLTLGLTYAAAATGQTNSLSFSV